MEKFEHHFYIPEAKKQIEVAAKMDLPKLVTATILESSKFSDFVNKFTQTIQDFTPKDKGDAFEWFAKAYFLAYSKMFDIKTYYTRLDQDIPESLGISIKDVGSDAILEHPGGELTLVQIKYRKLGIGLTREAVTGMASESKLRPDVKVRDMILFSNVYYPPRNLEEKEKRVLKFILKGDLEEANWELIKSYLAHNSLRSGKVRKVMLQLPELRDWQTRAVEWTLENGPNFGKVQIVAACGSGKTRCMREIMSLRSFGEYFYKKVLVTVPNLHLLSQWFEVLASTDPERNFLLVGSDLDVEEEDRGYYPKYHLTTSPSYIAEFWLDNESLIIISTYQSLDKIIDTRIDFDLCIVDEAHMCCSSGKESNFGLVTQDGFPSLNTVYTTATPKVFRTTKSGDKISSMDDERKFGRRFVYSFRQAIDECIVNDYRIVVGYGFKRQSLSRAVVFEDEFENDIDENDIDNFEAKFLVQSFEKHNLKNCLAFSSTHASSKKLYLETKKLIEEKNLDVTCLLMKLGSTSSDKSKAVSRIEGGERLIIFNVRVFGLGSDIVSLESVMLTQGRKSVIQTVQSISRCLRKQEGKLSKILVPCLLKDEEDLESEGGFKELRSFLASLGSVDEAIVEEVALGEKANLRRTTFDLVLGGNAKLNEIAESKRIEFETKLMERMADRNLGAIRNCEILREFCEKFNRLPKSNEKYRDVLIGAFLNRLIAGRTAIPHKDRTLGELALLSAEIKTQLISKLAILGTRKGQPSPLEKFNLLLDYCSKFNKLPKSTEEYQGTKLGAFFGAILGGEYFVNERHLWIKTLCETFPDLELQINSRLANQGSHKNKIPPEARFKLLFEFCSKFNKLPKTAEEYQGIKIGNFMGHLFGNQRYLDIRATWISSLCSISQELKEQISLKIKNKTTRLVTTSTEPSVQSIKVDKTKNITTMGNEARRSVSVIPPERKFEVLFEYCSQFGKLPKKGESYQGIKIGNFANGLIKTKTHPNFRDKWITKLNTVLNIKLPEAANEQNASKVLFEYCSQFDKLPKRNESYQDINIGMFLDQLITNQRLLPEKNDTLEQLACISENIDIQLHSRIEVEKVTKVDLTSEDRFDLLFKYCSEFDNLPETRETYQGVNVGQFAYKLFAKQEMFKMFRLSWISALSGISENIKQQIENKTNKKRHVRRDPTQQFEDIKKYCEVFNKLPSAGQLYLGAHVGINFGVMIRDIQATQNGHLDERIVALKSISEEISFQIDQKLVEIGRRKAQPSPEGKFELLLQYCSKYNKLPLNPEEYLGVKLGAFTGSLMAGKVFLSTRKLWLDKLCSISDDVATRIRTRAKNYA